MNVLINRTDAIGDTLLTIPMAIEIKRSYPHAKVIFLVSPRCSDLLVGVQSIDEVKVIDFNKGFFRNFWALKKIFKEFKINTYFYVGGKHLPSFVAKIIGVSFRGGIISRWPSFLFLNRGLRQKRSLVEMHEVEYNLDLLSPLGLKVNYDFRSLYTPLLQVSEMEKEKSLTLIEGSCSEQNVLFKKNWIVVHPGMSGHTLNWPAKNYARFILKFEKKLPDQYLFIVSHTAVDKKYIKSFQEEFGKSEYDGVRSKTCFYDGQVAGLRTTLSLFSLARLLLAPSTGPTHMANALGTNVVTIYSPIKIQSTARWGPAYNLSSKVRVVVPDVICGESLHCAGESCPYFECMHKIEVDEIVQKSLELLAPKN